MAIPAILGRRLRRPVVNLGFSGNGRMEPEVGALLAELDPCVYAIDCLPNMNEETVRERAAPLVRQIRRARPDTPILLVEDRSFTNTPFFPARKEHHRKSREALRRAFRELTESGVEQLYYLDGDHLLGLDGEAATDGSHPNDLGMVRYADAYEPVLRAILKQY
jgi:lysophospholipase L1-like esterase